MTFAKTLHTVAAIVMVIYLGDITVVNALPFVQSLVLKAAPVIILSLAALASRTGKNPVFDNYAFWVGVGLLICSAGDVFMDLQGVNQAYFLPGLGSFLVGHICYVIAFSVGQPALSISLKGVPLFFLAGGMFLMLRPTLPSDFVVPVIIYCIAIALMAAKALGRSGKQFATQGIAVASFGAVSFMISDSVLSYSLFKANFPGSRLVVMFTYYLAQLLIALSACDFYGGVAVKKD